MKQRPTTTPPTPRAEAAFSLLEAVVAMALCGLTIAFFYAAMSQSIRLAQASRQTALAAQIMEQRVDSLRSLIPWSKVTSPGDIANLLGSASPLATGFPPADEKLTVAAFPTATASFSVTRASTGAVSTSGSPLPATEQCVRVEMEYSWVGANRVPVTRTISTILTKGGV